MDKKLLFSITPESVAALRMNPSEEMARAIASIVSSANLSTIEAMREGIAAIIEGSQRNREILASFVQPLALSRAIAASVLPATIYQPAIARVITESMMLPALLQSKTDEPFDAGEIEGADVRES